MGATIPNDIKLILSEAGFDTVLSLASISNKDLDEIENFINTNREFLDHLTEYRLETNEPFKLKPGHRSLIAYLPTRMETFLKQIVDKKQLKNCSTKKSDFELKTDLINKVVAHLKSQGFTVKLATADISAFKKFENTYSCRIKCPYCDRGVTCAHVSYWRISNLITHLKEHIRVLKELDDDQEENNRFDNNTRD